MAFEAILVQQIEIGICNEATNGHDLVDLSVQPSHLKRNLNTFSLCVMDVAEQTSQSIHTNGAFERVVDIVVRGLLDFVAARNKAALIVSKS
jgi:hypothetical protein